MRASVNRTVGEHIRELESRLHQLNADLMETELDLGKRSEIEAEIRVTEVVLTHFRTAIKLEQPLSRTRELDRSRDREAN
jgi:hypothetical protein